MARKMFPARRRASFRGRWELRWTSADRRNLQHRARRQIQRVVQPVLTGDEPPLARVAVNFVRNRAQGVATLHLMSVGMVGRFQPELLDLLVERFVFAQLDRERGPQ